MSTEAPNPNRNTWGRRCSIGCETWPDNVAFQKCIRCGEETTRFSNVQPMSLADATSVLRHAQFAAYYEQHCKEQGIPVAGPLPEWYARSLGALPGAYTPPD